MAIRQYDPTIGQSLRSIAGLFAPPSAQEQLAYASAGAKRAENDRISQLFAAGKTPSEQAALAGIQNYGATPQGFTYNVDQDTAAKRYSADQGLAGTRYTADVGAATSLRTNAADNTRATITSMFQPLSQGQLRPALPADVAGLVGLPALGAERGSPKPLAESEVTAQIIQSLTPQQQAETVLGAETPVQAMGPDGRTTFMSPGAAVRTGAQPATDATKVGEQAGKLRGEIAQLPSYKNYAQAAPIYRSMVDTAGTNSKASDLNLVYGLGKIMDPTSVVREGEMVLVQNTASLPDWVVGAANRLNGGAALQPETRAALLAEAHSRMRSYEDVLGADLDRYGGIADRAGVRRDDVLPPFERSNAYRGGGRQTTPTFPGTPAQVGQEPRPPAAPSPPAPPAIPSDAVRVSTPKEAFALPPGTKFVTPDGRLKVRP
ncbi:hypothetical protein JOD31_001705 [Methylopila capsulata]|uniref:Uncharacterized protein n=1 Tax=Methylopila capsulata TaxID=61654 RepID=A0A9W6MQR8_9HYPH|nr:hypothetical protein [Methylopila capsulata]MBM7851480.1 hypothetical protein [Methylopila capsulata]GLK54538.1 hypothetical protein GCM10008170_05570 [Methylopila capsulata]